MNILATIRRRQKRWIPRLTAPFAIVWFSMLWQPCAVAMDMEMGMDHEQHSCPHCPPPMHEECGGNTAVACDYFDRLDTDRLATKIKFEEGPEDVQLALYSICEPVGVSLHFPPRSRISSYVTAPPGPPLNVLYCTYQI